MVPCQTQLFNPIETVSTSNKIAAEFVSTILVNPSRETVEKRPRQNITLDSIFPTHQEEAKITKARRILGEVGSNLSDEELEIYLTKFEFLLDTWLDTFEKQTFNGKTLGQLLREG
ncbi:MAG: hypothetical protein WC227_04150 [Patescibacteria group bacterium]|jgi:hypothetical protein